VGPVFSPLLFNGLLAAGQGGIGQRVLWRRSSLCPCRDVYSGQATPGCQHCHGKGIMWGRGVPAHTGLTSQKSARQWLDFSAIEQGDQVLTVPSDSPLYAAGENDLVIMADSSQPYQVVLLRDGDEKADPTAYAFDRCFWLRPGTQALVEAAIPRMDPATGALSWPDPEHAPEPGVHFTLRGRRRPVYFVFRDLPQDRAHAAGLPLPRRIVTRKFDLMGR
jgi:hypothetical protein